MASLSDLQAQEVGSHPFPSGPLPLGFSPSSELEAKPAHPQECAVVNPETGGGRWGVRRTAWLGARSQKRHPGGAGPLPNPARVEVLMNLVDTVCGLAREDGPPWVQGLSGQVPPSASD